MAKRILIDKVKLLDKLTYMGYMDEEKSEIEDVVNALSCITEQEIVKSYLDKLKAEIKELRDSIPFDIGEVKAKYTNIGQHDGLSQALDMIDDLLEEQA